MKRFESDTPKAVPFKSATKETPADRPWAYTLVPAVLALSAILVVFIAVGLFSLAVGWSIKVPLGAAGGVALGLFLYAAFRIDLIPYTIETVTGQDWNRDGYVGEPPQSLNVELHRTPRQQRLADLPGPPEVICEWARVAVADGSTSYALWGPRFGHYINRHGDKISLYREFRKVITDGDRPLALERGNHGLKLTTVGEDLFGQLALDGLGAATPLLDAQTTENDRWEPPTHTDTPAGEGDHHV